MFATQMATAINDARTLTRLDDLSKAIWQGFSAHAVTDDQAQSLAELIHTRRLLARGTAFLHTPPSLIEIQNPPWTTEEGLSAKPGETGRFSGA